MKVKLRLVNGDTQLEQRETRSLGPMIPDSTSCPPSKRTLSGVVAIISPHSGVGIVFQQTTPEARRSYSSTGTMFR